MAFGVSIDKDVVRGILSVHYRPEPVILEWKTEQKQMQLSC